MEVPNDSKKYMKHHFDKLTMMNGTRLHQILQTAQYSALYAIFGGIAGTLVEHVMPEYDPESSASQMIWEVIGQSALIGVFIFYVRKLVKVFPYLFNNDPEYIPYQKEYAVREYQGDIVLFIAFIATQSNYLKRVKHLKLWFGEKALHQKSAELEGLQTDANQVGAQGDINVAKQNSSNAVVDARQMKPENMPGQTQTTGGGMMRVTAPPTNPAMEQRHTQQIGPVSPPSGGMNGMMNGGMNGGMNGMMNGGMNGGNDVSNYFTNAPQNSPTESSFQSQTNLDSSLGQDSPDSGLTNGGFAPMTSGSMDYSYIDMMGGGNGTEMQSGNGFY